MATRRNVTWKRLAFFPTANASKGLVPIARKKSTKLDLTIKDSHPLASLDTWACSSEYLVPHQLLKQVVILAGRDDVMMRASSNVQVEATKRNSNWSFPIIPSRLKETEHRKCTHPVFQPVLLGVTSPE